MTNDMISRNTRAVYEVSLDEARAIERVVRAWTAADGIGTYDEACTVRDLLQKIRDAKKKADEGMRIERAPHEDAMRKVREGWLPILDSLAASENIIKKIVASWLHQQQAAGTPVSRVESAHGGPRAVTLRKSWSAKLKEWPLACETYRDHPDVAYALERAASADVRHGKREIPGFTVVCTESIA